METLPYVKFKRGLLVVDLEKQLLEVIHTRIKTLPNYIELRMNPELILLVCNIIENMVNDKSLKGMNKKELATKILNGLFSYNQNELKQLDTVIEFLHSTKKIKRVPILKKLLVVFGAWIKRKLL
jgi:hypothetical protein